MMTINKKIVFFYSMALLLSLYFREKLFFLFLASVGFYFLYFYHRVERQSKRMRIRREIPKKGVEKEEITLRYRISNSSPFSVNEAELYDFFEGSHSPEVKTTLSLEPHQMKKWEERALLDAGMGEKTLHSLKVILRDPLGLLAREKRFKRKEMIEVFPLVDGPSQIKADSNAYSHHFGEIYTAKKGESTNFMGVREYRPGDAIKKINWRQTVKHGKAIINLYEKNVNRTFTLLLNNDFRLHSGEGAESTLEYLKDELLALACDHIQNGNQIRIVTSNMASPLGSGSGFIKELEKFVYSIDLVKDEEPQFLIRRQSVNRESLVERETSFVYFTPILPGPLFTTNMEDLIALKESGSEVHVVWVNAFPFLHKAFPFGGRFSVAPQLEMTQDLESIWKKKCFHQEIGCLSYKVGRIGEMR